MQYTEEIIYTAICNLASTCDGARRQDGTGFNAFDSDFGKSLAMQPFSFWSQAQKNAAYKMLRKYKKQLAGYGIDYDQIPDPDTEESNRYIHVTKHDFKIIAQYNKALIDVIRDIPGRRYNGDGTWREYSHLWVRRCRSGCCNGCQAGGGRQAHCC